MKTQKFELSVTANLSNGKSINLPEYGKNGITYVEGRPGTNYSIKFRNNTADRVLAVFSVDGIDVLDGKPCTGESRGYIVAPYSACEISGWRTSLDAVSKFVFSSKDKSYSADKTGTEINCGIIGVKVFNEKQQVFSSPNTNTYIPYPVPVYPQWPYHYGWPYQYGPFTTWCQADSLASQVSGQANAYTTLNSVTFNNSLSTPSDAKIGSLNTDTTRQAEAYTASMSYACDVTNCSTKANETASFNLGTGWGEAKVDSVTTESFARGNEIATLLLYYSDATGLKDAGIDVTKKVAVESPLPQAFGGFCTPPKAK